MKLKYYEIHWSGTVFVEYIDTEQVSKPENCFTKDIRYISHNDDTIRVSISGTDLDGYTSDREEDREIITLNRNLEKAKEKFIKNLEDQKTRIDEIIERAKSFKDETI